MLSDRPYDFDRVFRLALTAAVALGLFWLVRELADILAPFVVAVLLAYLLNPLVTVLERRLGNRTAAVLLAVLGVVVVLLAILILLVPMIVGELARFDGLIDQLRDGSSALAARLRAALQDPQDARLAWLVERLRAYLVSDDFRNLISKAVQLVAPTALNVVAGALNVVFAIMGLTVVLIYLIFLLIDYRVYARNWKNYLPPGYRQPILEFLDIFQAAMRRYFRGQIIVAAITGLLFAIGFKIIGLPLGIVLGLIIGVLNMVPYLQSVAIVPAALLAILRAVESQSSVAVSLLMLAAVFATVQVVTDGFLNPRILGPAVGLRPVVIMLSLFIWGRLLGFVGLVLAIPLTCLGLAYYRRFALQPEPVDAGG